MARTACRASRASSPSNPAPSRVSTDGRILWTIESTFAEWFWRELSAEAPLLFLVAPALRVHPATDTLLRYLAPEIEWTLLGVDERWREGVRVIFRKRRTSAADERG